MPCRYRDEQNWLGLSSELTYQWGGWGQPTHINKWIRKCEAVLSRKYLAVLSKTKRAAHRPGCYIAWGGWGPPPWVDLILQTRLEAGAIIFMVEMKKWNSDLQKLIADPIQVSLWHGAHALLHYLLHWGLFFNENIHRNYVHICICCNWLKSGAWSWKLIFFLAAISVP